MDTPFLLATGNSDKAREICEVLVADRGDPLAAFAVDVGGVTVAFLVSEPEALPAAVAALTFPAEPPDVAETGATLEDNARIKATGVAEAFGLPAVADDTGLEVDALGGAPGVRSARYAGDGATYADNVARLLTDLAGVDAEHRTARFVTVALERWPDGREVVARGAVEGVVEGSPRGTGGFGYDPVFRPVEADGRTFAELSAEEKNSLSHRGRAFRALEQTDTG